MAFGKGYTPLDYGHQYVPEGDYVVKLGTPVDVQRGGWNIREIPIQIKGFQDYGPDKWSIFDAPSEPENLEKWNKARTRDADAFGVRRGDFNPASWTGKVGKVHIGKDKKGYMQVSYSLSPDSPHEEVRAPKPAPKPVDDPFDTAPSKAAQADDGFEDDIPF